MKAKARRESRARVGGGGGSTSGGSLFRRRNNRIDLLSDFKNDLDTSKDIYQLLREQLLSDQQSPWRGYELLYVVVINRKNKKSGSTNQSGISSSVPMVVETQHSFSHKHERYLVLLKKPDTSNGFFLIRVLKKENELEYKNSYELNEIKTLDYGSDESELLIQQESLDHSIYFNTQGDRDETLWILMQVIKLVTGSDVSIGYSVDVDGLAYMIANSGIFIRFPQLQKVISLSTSNFHDQFSADEAEAEHILDEINWGSSLSGQKDLQSILSQRSDKLNNEIIDFLLQWEEMDEAADAKSNGNYVNSKQSFNISSSSSRPQQGSTSSSTSSMLGMRDTREVLKALSLVDEELKAVETWLGDQIKKLSSIKSNLSLIEDESGGLETSWQNLNIVQKVIDSMIEKYSFEDFEENLLKSPDAVINSVLKSSTLNIIDQTLDPLIKAGKRLRSALVVKQADLHGISAADWKQIQAIAAISQRKEQLMAIADIFCSKFGEIALVLFDKLLKHKSLQEGDSVGNASGKISSASGTLIPKSFTTRSIVEQLSVSTMYIDVSKYFTKTSNQLLESQALFHTYLAKFSDLLDLQAELASASSRALCEAYMRATHERLYAPLVKAFTKDLQSMITLKQAPITLSSATKYKLNVKNELQIFFQPSHNTRNGSGQGKIITSWKCFETAITLLAPVIATEENFIKKLFHLDGRRTDTNDQTNQSVSLTIDETTFLQSRLHTMLEAVFEGIIDRLFTLASSAATNSTIVGSQDIKDGIESVAMLTCLSQYLEGFIETIQLFEKNEGNQQFQFLNSTLYLMKMFKSLRYQLEHIILSYANEQIQWIHNQRADPKSSEVLSPFLRFPTVIMHVIQMTNGKTFDCVDELLVKLARELLSWLTTISKLNEKYVDKVKLTNLVYFHLSLLELNVPCLEQFVVYSQQQILETSVRYINWMVEYEFPALSALALRIDGIGKKVNDEDLSLYIRRKDVLSVIKELENKTLDSLIGNLSKRIEKHFKCDTDLELNLMAKMWTQLKERIVSIVKKLEAAASTSYQIKLDITPSQLSDIFDKYALAMQH